MKTIFKKLIDRRMIGFLISIGALILVLLLLAPEARAGVALTLIGGIVGLYGVLVTGNVVQAFSKNPTTTPDQKPEGQ